MRPLESFIGTPLAGAIGWALLHSLWQGAVIAAALAVVLIGTKSPRIRYAAACLAMLAMVSAFAVTLAHMIPAPTAQFSQFPTARWFAPAASATGNASAPKLWPSLAAVAPWLAPFWILGLCLLSAQHLVSLVSIRRLTRRGVCCAPERWTPELARLKTQLSVSRAVRLLESSLAEVPMVIGHFRPVILMPLGLLVGLPPEQTETILLHELAHIRRYDYLVNVLERAVESLLFYHPAIWWISKVIRSERENCCDDLVVSISRHSHEYALALATLERNRQSARGTVLAATGGMLMKRIRRLLYPKSSAGVWSPAIAAVILIITSGIAVAALQAKVVRPRPVAVPLTIAIAHASGAASRAGGTTSAAATTMTTDFASKGRSADFLKAVAHSRDDLKFEQVIPSGKQITVLDKPEKTALAADAIVKDVPVAALSAMQVPTQAIRLNPLSRTPINITATEDSAQLYVTIASLAGLNVEFDPSFSSQRVSINISGVALEQALDILSNMTGNKWAAVAPNTFVVARDNSPKAAQDANQTVHLAGGDRNGTITTVTVATAYTKWLDQDAVYIVTPEERDTFLHLATDEERDQFINAFWERRNPTPGASDNKFKDEHYRRIAYANQHFTAGDKAGWQTDRGHMFIVYGPPNQIEVDWPNGTKAVSDGSNASVSAERSSYQLWRYNHIDGIGDNLVFEFIAHGEGDMVLAPAPQNPVR